mmetsp:Transcript_42174/g.82737  ORF Transcript_42174/g.82737 Transcript_42174/m.82737 type:complete len:297 (+) Transcript_42174:161-1051(+)|eukprot:CAMPEP_0194329376 /NCGR_PEP_ID=MMETSP0171-20130528/48101_1 /TAXON_ID=218684 /ORGANISM="Corethron pennatum, Strain L29A3" /LENGTH=296 /DNA_ID=CAMNT_0039090099 /DNA_START=155 /DNA_END=1045 /DNA_ORIENTATION=-
MQDIILCGTQNHDNWPPSGRGETRYDGTRNPVRPDTPIPNVERFIDALRVGTHAPVNPRNSPHVTLLRRASVGSAQLERRGILALAKGPPSDKAAIRSRRVTFHPDSKAGRSVTGCSNQDGDGKYVDRIPVKKVSCLVDTLRRRRQGDIMIRMESLIIRMNESSKVETAEGGAVIDVSEAREGDNVGEPRDDAHASLLSDISSFIDMLQSQNTTRETAKKKKAVKSTASSSTPPDIGGLIKRLRKPKKLPLRWAGGELAVDAGQGPNRHEGQDIVTWDSAGKFGMGWNLVVCGAAQ